jgi:hypothetical protein
MKSFDEVNASGILSLSLKIPRMRSPRSWESVALAIWESSSYSTDSWVREPEHADLLVTLKGVKIGGEGSSVAWWLVNGKNVACKHYAVEKKSCDLSKYDNRDR